MPHLTPTASHSPLEPASVPLRCSDCDWDHVAMSDELETVQVCPQCHGGLLRLESESVFAPVATRVRFFFLVAVASVSSVVAFVLVSTWIALVCSIAIAVALGVVGSRQRNQTRVVDKTQWVPLVSARSVPDGFHISKPLAVSYAPPPVDPFHEAKIARAKALEADPMTVPMANGEMHLVHEDHGRSSADASPRLAPHPISLSAILLPQPSSPARAAMSAAVHHRGEWETFAATSV